MDSLQQFSSVADKVNHQYVQAVIDSGIFETREKGCSNCHNSKFQKVTSEIGDEVYKTCIHCGTSWWEKKDDNLENN